ncbi:PAS domain S-box protein [Coleofasciculus sp. FACHB-1120]|uniref:PAS domain S-box protein n=1 Tax=Coleofasciculus sp. FACHB-1120 TaxID=2692783 RepID=UPI00198FCFEA|nr:PAS domain S-box protein [Coleofasciculus sp. FACHB-1120]MBD2743520.1 PAS domain S-box protein [Coleofasciculus sp. FACHB-1120]
MLKKIDPRLRRYGVAVLAVASAGVLTLWLFPHIQPHISPLFFAAVMLSSWYGGLKPGLLATVLSTLTISYFFISPFHSVLFGGGDILRLAVFGLVALFISWIGAELKAAKQRAERNRLKVRASEERYRSIVETANEGIWLLDAQLRIEYVNQRLAEMFGYGVEEMLGRSIFDFMDEEARIQIEQSLERGNPGIKEQFDFRYRRKDGSTLWAIVSTNLIFNEGGISDAKGEAMPKAIAMLTDVTERKAAEEELKRYQLLSQHSRDIVLYVQLDGQIIEANQAAIQAYGYSKSELLSLKINNLRAPETLDLIDSQLKQADKQGILFETIHCRKNGTFFPVEVSAQSLLIGDRKIVLSIIRDITERKQAEALLRNSEERYRAFIEQSSEGIWRFELEQPIPIELSEDEQIKHFYQYGYLAECNRVMAQMYGFNSTEEIIGVRLETFLIPSEPHNLEYLRAFIQSGYRLNDAESYEVDKEGNSKYFLNNLVGIVENGFLVRAWGSQRDISESLRQATLRKQAEENSRQLANELQEQASTLDAILSASVDHIYIFDREGRYKYVSTGGAQVVGFEPSELVGKTWRDIGLPEEIMSRFDAHREEVIATGEPIRKENEFLTASGLQHYEYIVAPLHNQDKSIKGLVVISRDITQRKQAEAALRESETRARRLIESNIIGVIIADFSGNILEANDVFCNIVGYTQEEVLSGKANWAEMTPPEYRHLDMQAMEEMQQKGSHTPFEKEYIRKDGTRVPVLVGTGYLGGSNQSGVGFAIDLSESLRHATLRKRAEQELRISETRFRALVDQSPLSTQIMAPDGRIIQVNRAWEKLWGITLDQIPEYNLLQDHQLVAKGIMPYIQRAFAGEAVEMPPIVYDVAELGDYQDQERWTQAFIYPVKDEAGNICEVVLVHEDITEHIRVEEALRESEERFRTFFEEAPIGISVVDLNGRFVKINKTYCEMLGYPEQELSQLTFADITHPEDVEKDWRYIEQIFKGEVASYQIEKRYIKKNGEILWINLTATAIFDREGKACYGLGMVEDISESRRHATLRKRTEEALQATNQTLDSLIQACPLGITVLSLEDGTVKLWNPADERIFGWSEQEVVGRFLPSILEDKRDEFLAQLDAIEHGRTLTAIETRRRKKDGSLVDISVWACPVRDAQGNLSCMSIVADISDRKQLEQERNQLLLNEQQRATQLRGLADAALAINSTLSIEQRLQAIAEQARTIIGAHQSHANLKVNQDWAQSINAISLSDKYAPRREFLEKLDGTGIYSLVCQRNRPMRLTQAELEAHPAWKEFGTADNSPMRGWLAAPLIGHNGNNIGLIHLSDKYEGDFSEQDEAIFVQLAQMASVAVENARLYREAQEANRTKDEFLATLSHELRTPLNAMLGWTQLLRTRKFDAATVARALETIDRNTRALSQLIEDVLDVSRIITGKLRLNVRPIELVPVIEAAIDTVLPAAEAKNIQIDARCDRSAGIILGDSARLQQVFWNLLSNAVKFTPKGGRIEVKLSVEIGNGNEHPISNYAQIRVTDTGQGISADFLPYVFERFRQADGTTTRSHGGLGLGLAIVRHLVELQGGTVCAQSPGLGLGTTFIVNLPLRTDEVRKRKDELDSHLPLSSGNFASPVSLDGLRVLIVDDEADAREVLIAILEQYQAQVTAVTGAGEALEALHRLQTDILVSDIGMPGEDGYALIRKVRALDTQSGKIPAVCLSAYASAEDRTKALQAGFQVHIPKPVNPAELATAIANLTGRIQA